MTSYGPHQTLLNIKYNPKDHLSKPYITLPTGWTYLEYNDEGQVTKVTKPNGDIIEFTYYATGKRAKKVLKIGENTTTWKYHWDGDIPVKIEKVDGDPAYFTFLQPGDILTMTYQSNTYFYVTNIRGDVTALLDVDGNQVASYKYDVWGNPTITNPNNLPNPFLYQGAYATFYDQEFLMYGMGARHYNPNTMRFTSRDANHGTITNTMSQNLYIYCYNNPIRYKDPSGFEAVCGGGSFRGRNNDPFGKDYANPNPIPDGAGYTDLDSKAMYDAWAFIVENKITDSEGKQYTWDKFLKIWNQAKELSKKIMQYNNQDLNKIDIQICFITCLWNDKAKLGLDASNPGGVTDKLIGLANTIKAICYFESRCGTDQTAIDEGAMGVKSQDSVVNGHWIEGYIKDISVKTPGGLIAGLYVGVAHFLQTMAVMSPGVPKTEYNGFIGLDQSARTGMFTDSNYRLAARAYGGDNDFVVNYFRDVLGYQNGDGTIIWNKDRNRWGLKDGWYDTKQIAPYGPYGNAVVDLATTGSFTNQDGKPVKLLP